MIDFLKRALREHLLLCVLAVPLLPLGLLSAAALFISYDREMVYDGYLVFSHCGSFGMPGGKDCIAQYDLLVGNTGVEELDVQVSWPADLRSWAHDRQVINITADRPRKHDPTLACTQEADQTQCAIEHFAPGALLILSMKCLYCTGRDVATLDGAPVQVQTVAKVFRGDPRVTSLFRRLGAFQFLF